MEFNSAIVTGGSGFLGSRLCKRLVSEDWNVVAIVRPQSNLHHLKQYVGDRLSVFVYEGNYQELERIMRSCKPDVVFHLASRFIGEHKTGQIYDLLESNIGFGTFLLESMVDAGVENLVNIGTTWQNPVSSKYNPVNLYAATKQAFETILQFYVESRKINALTLKLCDTYGPYDLRGKIVALLIDAAMSGHKIDLTTGVQKIDLLFIEDVLNGILIAGELVKKKKVNGSFFLSSGALVSIREVSALVELITNKKINGNWGARNYRSREIMVPWIPEPILPEWGPNISLFNGLVETVSKLNKTIQEV